MTRRRPRTRPASTGDALLHLAKAQEFLRAASEAGAGDNLVAATANPVHAGIAAADAITAVKAGSVWRGEHDQAAGHLEAIGEDASDEAARHLRRLLPLKGKAEYEPVPIPRSTADTALLAAKRIIAIADKVVREPDAA